MLAAPARRRSSNVSSARSNTGKYSGSRSRLARNGKPVAQIALSGTRSLTRMGSPSRNAPPPRRAAYTSTEHRRVHHADHRLAVGDERDRHADHREPVHEVGGAVERIDEPSHVGPLAAALLAEEREVGRGVVQHRRAPPPRWRCRRRSPSRRALLAHVARHHRTRRARRARPRPRRGRRRRAGRRDRVRGRAHAREPRRCSAASSSAVPAATSWRRASASSTTSSRPLGVDDGRAGFPTHEQAAEVVPRRVLVGDAVEVPVEVAGGDVAERERGRTERPELAPRRAAPAATPRARPPHGRCRRSVDGVSGVAVERRALPADRGVARAGGAVLHQGAQRTVGVDRAQRDRPVREVPRAVGRAVDRIDDHGDRGVGRTAPARLLAEHADAGGASTGRTAASATRSSWYWPGRSVRAAPFGRTEGRQGASLRGAGDVEECEQIVRASPRRGLDGDDRVVVGHARCRVAPAAAQQHVALGEEHLDVAGPQVAGVQARRASRRRRSARRPRSPSRRPSAAMSDGAMNNASRIAPVSGSRSSCTMVLNCLPRRVLSTKLPRARRAREGATDEEVRLAVGRGERAALAEARAAPLDGVAGGARSRSTPE